MSPGQLGTVGKCVRIVSRICRECGALLCDEHGRFSEEADTKKIG
jgi:hypothetical protein